MNTDDAALLQAIVARPDDDAPRLVYADLLVERGDPRGEFIQLQCQQAKTGNTPALQKRIGELLSPNEARWKAEAGIVGALTNFHRGFPRSLIGDCGALLQSLPALRTQPVVSVSVMGAWDRLPELAAAPELARVRELSVSAVQGRLPVAAAHVEALAASPHLASGALRELTFDREALDTPGAQALARAPWLRGLEKVVLANQPASPPALAAVLAPLHAARWLWLENSSLGDDGLDAIARSSMRALEFLGAPRASLGKKGFLALVDSPVLRSVTELVLDGNYLGDDALVALARSPNVGRVQVLQLASNSLTAVAAQALAESTSLSALQSLVLHDNRLGHAGVEALARGRGLPALRKLGLTKNGVGTGRFESWGDAEYSGTSEVEETAAELAARFTHRPGLVVT